MAHVDELVTRPIPLDLERGHAIPERDLEPALGPEGELANARMQPIGADDQIDHASVAVLEPDPHPLTIVLDRDHGVAEDRLDLAVQAYAGDLDDFRRFMPANASLASVTDASLTEYLTDMVDRDRALDILVVAERHASHDFAVAGVVHFDGLFAGGRDPRAADEKLVAEEHFHILAILKSWSGRRRRRSAASTTSP